MGLKNAIKKRLSKMNGRLRREGRRLASLVLCGVMVAGNLSAVPVSVLADSDTDNEFTYEIERAALQEALQTAVSEGNTVDETLEFAGEHAEEYAQLLEADGTLYELEPVMDDDDDRDQALNLRVFARIEGSIPVDSMYEIDGTEEIVFLMSNKTELTVTATICVDELETEAITVLPADAITVEEESTAIGNTTTVAGTIISGVSGSSANGGGSSGSATGVSVETGETESAENEVEIDITDTVKIDETDADSVIADSEVSIIDETNSRDGLSTDENDVTGNSPAVDEQASDAGEAVSDSTGESEDEADDIAADKTAEADIDAEADIAEADTEEKEEVTENTGVADAGDEDTVTADEDSKSGDSTDSSSDSTDNDPDVSNAGDTYTSDKKDAADGGNTDTTGNGNVEDDANGDNSSDITEDSKVTVEVSAISIHRNILLTAGKATASDADETASSSDAVKAIDGILYESVQFDKKGTAAFATTAADLKLDEIRYVEYTSQENDVIVTVTASSSALPRGAELSVTLYDEDSDEYAAAAEAIDYTAQETGTAADDEDAVGEAAGTSDEEIESDESSASTGLAVLDISFLVDGEEVEPTEAVTVSIDASGILPEDADASTMEVQHLTRTEDGLEATLVADAKDMSEGIVDADSVTAEFEVKSFSTFTISWSYTEMQVSKTTSVTVNVYDTDKKELDVSTTSITGLTNGTSRDLTTVLTIDGYTFDHAEVTTSSMTISNATAISYTKGNGPGGTYTVTTSSGGQETIQDNNGNTTVTVNLYYKLSGPSVTLSAEETNAGYILTAALSNFTGTDITYTWSVNDTDSARISDNGTTATLTWADNVSSGTAVTVTVTATSTYTNTDDQTVTETATNTCTVYYGTAAAIQFKVVYPTSSSTSAAASGVTVTVKDANGNTVAAGTTNSSGEVTLQLMDGVTYTVETSEYTSGNYTYSYSGSVTANAANGNVISLMRSSGTYEHIDIKYTNISSETTTQTITGITNVYLYDSSGELINYTTSIEKEDSKNNWQTFWNTNTGNNGHSISFSTDYTVVIVYEVYDSSTNKTETYTATIDADTTYPEGSYYPADGACAYHLYNYIYGTNYTSTNWTSSNDYAAVKDTGIDVSGMTYFEVAIVLCDSWGAQQNGLDFALDVQSLLNVSANWDFEVLKTYENGSMETGDFTFTIYSATSDASGVWTLGDLLETKGNSAAAAGNNGNSRDTVSFTQINFSTSNEGTYYYMIRETPGDNSSVTYDGTIYGVKLVVAVTTSTSGNVTTYETTVTPTYYKLTAITDDAGNITEYSAEEITLNKSTENLPVFPFTNTYGEGKTVTIKKINESGTQLENATFTLMNNSSKEYYSIVDNTESWSTVGTGEKAPAISLGTATITLADGIYTLTEVSAPAGYKLLSNSITITVAGGVVTAVTYGGATDTSIVTSSGDGLTVAVINTAGTELPETGGPGTTPFRIAGLLLTSCSAYLIYKTLRRKGGWLGE